MAFCLLALIAGRGRADDWPAYRGPTHDGHSTETLWLRTWPPAGPPVAWRAEVGTGLSAVTVSGGRAYTIGNRENVDTVYCLDAVTGAVVWQHVYDSPLDDRYFDGGPTSTPTIDGDRVYTLGRQGELFCFDAATGRIQWSQNVTETTGAPPPGWGFGASPLVHGDRLLLTVGEAGAALDKRTGELLWKSYEDEAGYAMPQPIALDGRELLLVPSGRFWHCVDLATGEELWRHRWLTRFGCNAAAALVRGEQSLISSGYNRGTALLQLGATEPEVLWTTEEYQNQFNSSVLVGQHIYGVDGDTTGERRLKCLAWDSGRVVWEADGVGSAGLIVADGSLIILSESGELIVAPAVPEGFAPTARAQVLEGSCWTIPVLAQGRIYCRNSAGSVVCVDVRDMRAADR